MINESSQIRPDASESADTNGAPYSSGKERDTLKPLRDIQKFLISSTCRFAGEFETPTLLIAHAWPSLRNRAGFARMDEGPVSRNAFALIFRTDPTDQGGIVIPNYERVGDLVCAYLSVLFGKRFDNHGPIESSGFFNIPDLSRYETINDLRLPQNAHKARADFGIQLSLNEVGRLTSLMFDPDRRKEGVVFRSAIKFYHQALQLAEYDIEVAYLHLITAGEILSAAIDLPAEKLLDAQTRVILQHIRTEMTDGKRAARIILSRVRSVRRRFVVALDSLIDPSFFAKSEAQDAFAALRRSSFIKVLSAAYDLRSRYVHTGQSFGIWIAPRGPRNEEVQIGRPVVDEKDYARILAAAPTYIGLERIIRYCLLRFATRLGADLP